MHFDQAVGMVLYATGQIESLRPQVVDTMEYAKEMLERNPEMRPWFLLSSSTELFEAGNQYLAMPENFLAESPEGFMKTSGKNTFWKKIQGFQLDDVADTTLECYRWIYPTTLEIPRILTEDISVQLYFYSATPPLRVVPASNLWLTYGSDLLIAKTAEMILSSLHEDQGALVQAARAQGAERRLLAESIERMNGNLT
jgi:hypothetical protein